VSNAGDVSGARCFNHAGREAAARCPRCRRHFCRECVTEHKGLVLCSACLKQAAAEAPRRGVPALVRLAAGGIGLSLAWVVFYLLGRLLLLLPASFHEGTMWNP
jgi:hypothetical protein